MSNSCYTAAIEAEYWQDQPLLRFRAGGYEAVLIPGVGGQIIELKDLKRGLDLLRTPDRNDLDGFKARPQVYGIPLLFPPNRIEDGKFPIAGRMAQFPINANGNNHIHGFLRVRPWKVVKTMVEGELVEIETIFEHGQAIDEYDRYIHELQFKLHYTLSSAGLEQRLTIIHQGAEALPIGVGLHTALKVPFHPGSQAGDCRLRVSVGDKWELNERNLPTGKLLPLSEEEQAYRSTGIMPQGEPIYDHCIAREITLDGKPFHGAVLEDHSQKLRLVYRVGPQFKHWAIWNENGDKGFICPEPQSWVTNAPHLKLPSELTGYRLLNPGETWTEQWGIYVEDFK